MQAVKAAFGPSPAVLQPAFHGRQRVEIDPAVTRPTTFFGCDEAGLFEYAKMLTNRGQRHIQRLGKLAHAHLAVAKPRDDPASRRIGERGKGGIETGIILKHMLQYCHFLAAVNSDELTLSRTAEQTLRE